MAAQPAFEKLLVQDGTSFRCFNRQELRVAAHWHRHPEIELTYVEKGHGTRLVGDHIGTYEDHDLVLIGSDVPHTWLSDAYRGQKYDRHPAIVSQFRSDFLGTAFLEAPEMSPVRDLLRIAERAIWFPPAVAMRVGPALAALTRATGPRRICGLLEVLSELVDHVREGVPLASEGYSADFSVRAESRIGKVCDYISQHLTDPDLDQPTLAEIACMEPSAFSRFFKRSTGRTVTAYVNEMRIGLACRLLMTTEASILDICFQTGYNNVSNFNRRFRDIRGMTPREYRRECGVLLAADDDDDGVV